MRKKTMFVAAVAVAGAVLWFAGSALGRWLLALHGIR
jgi:hypothetical protein